jgi:hypothetical protein
MKQKLAADTRERAVTDLEGDMGYLRTHLDSPGYFVANRLGSGLIARFLRGWQISAARPSRLALIARIELGARQTVALIEAEGQRLLVASSADGAASFFSLNGAESRRHVSFPNALESGPIAEETKPLGIRRKLSRKSGFSVQSARFARAVSRVSW